MYPSPFLTFIHQKNILSEEEALPNLKLCGGKVLIKGEHLIHDQVLLHTSH